MQAYHTPEIQVALFGHVDIRNCAAGEVKWLRWGVFDSTTEVEQTFEVEEDDLARIFIHQAPTTNCPDFEKESDENGNPLFDSKGKPCLKPTSNHYAMASYAKRFRASLICDEERRTQKVVLQRISLLDNAVVLDENNWAVTLVSTEQSSQNWLSRFFRENVGHAMLACEGVEQGKQFLRYLHLTRNPRNKNPVLEADQAQMESFDREIPLKTLNGPTWIRPKSLVKNMLHFVQGMESNEPQKFVSYKMFFSDFKTSFDFLRKIYTVMYPTRDDLEQVINQLEFSISHFEHDINQLESPVVIDSPQEMDGTHEIATRRHNNCSDSCPDLEMTCLDGAYEIASIGGIIFSKDLMFKKPIERIKQLNSSPFIFHLPENFDPESLFRPIEDRKIAEDLLSAQVVLAPENFSSFDCVRLKYRINIELLNLIREKILHSRGQIPVTRKKTFPLCVAASCICVAASCIGLYTKTKKPLFLVTGLAIVIQNIELARIEEKPLPLYRSAALAIATYCLVAIPRFNVS